MGVKLSGFKGDYKKSRAVNPGSELTRASWGKFAALGAGNGAVIATDTVIA